MANLFRAVAEFLTPVSHATQLYESGTLTPEEFVRAGDELVAKCPTWSWAAGVPGSAKPYLPADKQFLITRAVPSTRRADALDADAREELVGTGDEEWTVTHAGATPASSSSSATAPTAAAASAAAPAPVEDIPDLDDFEFDEPTDDRADALVAAPKPGPAAAPAAAPEADAAAGAGPESSDTASALRSAAGDGVVRVSEPAQGTVATRTYDISICYDKRYRTPRVYLAGYDAAGQPLGLGAVMEDVSGDHAFKTVTQEAHPHVGTTQLSIHPCRHGETMKRLFDGMLDAERDAARQRLTAPAPDADDADRFKHLPAGERPAPAAAPLTGAELDKKVEEEAQKAFRARMPAEKYIFLFLKFIASVIPTIEYDYTLSVQL